MPQSRVGGRKGGEDPELEIEGAGAEDDGGSDQKESGDTDGDMEKSEEIGP